MKAIHRIAIALLAVIGSAGCGTGYYEERLADTDLQLRQGTFRWSPTGQSATVVTEENAATGEGEGAAPATDPAAPAETPPSPAPPSTKPDESPAGVGGPVSQTLLAPTDALP